MSHSIVLSAVFAASLFTTAVSHAVSVDSLSDFNDGLDDGWNSGNPILPNATVVNQQLEVITSNPGGNPLSRLIVVNSEDEWTGDWASVGITGVSVYAENNNSSESLYLRLTITDEPLATIGQFSDYYTSQTAFVLAPGETGSFTFELSDLAQSSGSGTSTITEVLGAVSMVRIASSQGFDHRGDVTGASMILDDIQVVAPVPLPAPALLLATSLPLLGRYRARR